MTDSELAFTGRAAVCFCVLVVLIAWAVASTLEE